MKLLTDTQYTELLLNGSLAREAARLGLDFDPLPLVKLYQPDGYGVWLLSDIDTVDTDRAYGLCDSGHGFPDVEYVSLSYLLGQHGNLRYHVVQDSSFVANKPLSVYATLSRTHGYIVR